MSKAISARPDIIHHDQSGHVIRDRSIGKTVFSIFGITDFSIKENIPGLLININYQKAFGSVECGLQLPKGV